VDKKNKIDIYRFFMNFSRKVRLFLNVSKEEGVFGECFQESRVLS